MSQSNKTSVIDRLRRADHWLGVNGGPPLQWMRALLQDAAQELESESGALWLQTVTGRDSHVRIFVQGPFALRELDLLLEILQLTHGWMERDVMEAPSVAGDGNQQERSDAVDPAAPRTVNGPTRE